VANEKNAVLLARLPGFLVANIASQEKRIHRSERERDENRRYTSSVKTSLRSLEAAVAAKDADAADAEYRTACSRIDKAVRSGAYHRNTGARKKARAARLRSSI
jgi:small subunit ribosomal protein S20